MSSQGSFEEPVEVQEGEKSVPIGHQCADEDQPPYGDRALRQDTTVMRGYADARCCEGASLDLDWEQSSWTAHTQAHLQSARALRQAALDQLQVKPQVSSTKLWSTCGVADLLKKRVATAESFTKALLARIETTTGLTEQVSQCGLRLQQEHALLSAPMGVVEKRLELRSQRPSQELLQDHVEEALSQEQSTFAELQRLVLEHLAAGREMLAALVGAKAAMVEEVQSQRHVLRLSRSCLLFDPFHGLDRACVLPQMGTRDHGHGEAARHAAQEALASRELLARTVALEESARRYCSESDAAVLRARREAKRATKATTASLQRHVGELSELKRRLEAEAAESGETVNRLEQAIEAIAEEIARQRELDHDHGPLKFDQRLPKSLQLSMREAASARVREQADATMVKIKELEEWHDTLGNTLAKLAAVHKDLVDNLWSKSKALRIDIACSKLHAQSSAEHAGGSEASCLRSPRAEAASFRAYRPALDPRVLVTLRSKIKAAAFGSGGRAVDVLFGRLDKDGSGILEEEEVRMALRRTFRIPHEAVSDTQISALCAKLDADGSGSVSINELVAFVGADAAVSRRTGRSLVGASLGLESASTMEFGPLSGRSHSGQASALPLASPRRRRVPPLDADVLAKLRSRIKSAAYAGHLGVELEALFGRFDKDGSGQLEEEEVRQALRRTLRIPPSIITDAQITSLCSALDADSSGAVSISEMVDFIGMDKRTGRRSAGPSWWDAGPLSDPGPPSARGRTAPG